MAAPDYLDEEYTTEDTIRTRMLGAITEDVDKSEGSYIWDSIAPAAIEFAFVAMALRRALKLGFAQTTSGKYLTMRAEESGVTRKTATNASGHVTVTGTAGTVVPKETRLCTEGDNDIGSPTIMYTTDEAATISNDGTVTVGITAVESGPSGNVIAGKVVVVADTISGVTSVTNKDAITGGSAEEDDDTLCQRYLEYVKNRGTSGNKQHYKQLALEVPGVYAAKVIPLWNGNGTVKVVIIGSDKKPATDSVVEAVQKYIGNDKTGSGHAPIGATCTVVAAGTKTINVTANVKLKSGYSLDSVKTELSEKIDDSLKENEFETSYVSYAKIGALIIELPSVSDYESLQLNGTTGNITLSETEIAVLGSVILNEIT